MSRVTSCRRSRGYLYLLVEEMRGMVSVLGSVDEVDIGEGVEVEEVVVEGKKGEGRLIR